MPPLPSPSTLTAAAARRIALAAQGFDRPRPSRPPSVNQIASLVGRLGVLQLDSVNVFCAPTTCRCSRGWARTTASAWTGSPGTAPGGSTADCSSTGRTRRRCSRSSSSRCCAGGWPTSTGEAWGSISRIAREQPELVAESLELVAQQGPIRARDTGAVRPPPRPGHMWNWHEGKIALEYLFFTGGWPPRGGSTSSGSTTCPSGSCPPRSSSCRRPRRRTPSAS